MHSVVFTERNKKAKKVPKRIESEGEKKETVSTDGIENRGKTPFLAKFNGMERNLKH